MGKVLSIASLLFTAFCFVPGCAAEVGEPGQDEGFDENVGEVVQDLTVCANNPVPGGYVVTQRSSTPSCSPYYTYTVKLPYDGVVMCAGLTPIPDGWVPVAKLSSSSCTPYWGYALKEPYNGIIQCSLPSAGYPAGWVVTEVLSASSCDIYWGRRLAQPYAGIVVCASSPTPAGWIRTSQVSTGKCNGEWGYVLQHL